MTNILRHSVLLTTFIAFATSSCNHNGLLTEEDQLNDEDNLTQGIELTLDINVADYNLVYVNSNGDLQFRNGVSNDFQKTVTWTKSLRLNSICGKYSQETNESDVGTWRMPNIKELALLYLEGLVQSAGGYRLSCTHGYFVNSDFVSLNSDDDLYLL